MLENIIYCKLQSTCYTLQSLTATCDNFKKVIPIVEKSGTEFWNWCYKLQFFLRLFLQCWERKSIASYSRHVTRCNLRQELPKFQKKSLQPFKKIESSSTQCNRWKPKIIARQVAEKTCCTLQSTFKLACFAVVTQVVKRIVSCSTSFICADSASQKKYCKTSY